MARHAISIDTEDWYQSLINVDGPPSEHFAGNVRKILDILAAREVRGTFFLLGLACRHAPQTVKAIADAGHEIQSHGFGHRDVDTMSADEFREDLLEAKKLVEDLTGKEVFGYRAPNFSINETTPWAHDVLLETGHRYDSSIFPVKMRRYGQDGYPPEPRIIETRGGGRIVEAPVACFDWLGKRRPIGGGGYFRLWPYRMIRKAWRQLDRLGRPGVVYMHPSEFNPTEMSGYRDEVPWKVRFHQGLWRGRFAHKVDRLLGEFDFGSMEELLAPLLAELR
jgi:polysaccharide deacetylase family protein (PEP-CTERM system associated)